MNAELVPRSETQREAAAVTVTDARAADGADWQRFVAAAPGAEIYHDYRWRALIEGVFGHECVYLLARDATGEPCGVLPLVRLRSRLFGDFLVSVPYFNYGGVLGAHAEAEQALLAAAAARARALGVTHAELRHRAGAHSLDWPKRDSKVTMLLDLPATEDELFRSFGSKLRAQIKRPEKAGATSRFGGVELLDDFYAVFARNMRDLGTPVYPRRFFRAILETFGAEARLCIVDLRGKPVAAGFVVTHRGTMEIPWASSLREANRDSVNMMLYWSVLRAAVAAGCKRFDFGRSSKDSGTFKFKAQWGAEPEALEWHYWLAAGGAPPEIAPSNPKYRLAIALWQRLPVPVANFLGPHIVKNLP
jgi:serine/alanine adding enzyme